MNGEARARILAALGEDAIDGNTVRTRGGADAMRAVEILAGMRVPWRPGASEGTRLGVAPPATPPLLDLWPQDLVARVAAGTTFADLDAELATHGLRLAAPAPAPARTTVGAAYATAERGLVCGLGRSLRELALGLRAVDGGGRPLAAGARVVKNVAGYDLTRLHHGAHGSFGLVLDLVVRLEARPAAAHAWFVPTADAGETLDALRRPAVDLEPFVQTWLSAASAAAIGWGDQAGILVAADGADAAVAAWSGRVGTRTGARRVDWTAARELGTAAGERVVRGWPGRATDRWRAVERDLRARRIDARLILDLGGGEARLALPQSAPLPPLPGRGGRATGPAATILRRLRKAFDPHGLLPAPPEVLA